MWISHLFFSNVNSVKRQNIPISWLKVAKQAMKTKTASSGKDCSLDILVFCRGRNIRYFKRETKGR